MKFKGNDILLKKLCDNLLEKDDNIGETHGGLSGEIANSIVSLCKQICKDLNDGIKANPNDIQYLIKYLFIFREFANSVEDFCKNFSD